MRRLAPLSILAVLVIFLSNSPAMSAEYAVGVVFHDANTNGVRDPGEEGIPGVKVSNGRTVVKTDEQGRYRLPVDDWTVIFVTKPSGWMTPVCENNLPRFYYIHKPEGSPPLRYPGIDPTGSLPESVDFPLYRHEEPDKFKVVVFGDTQPYEMHEVFFVTHDTIAELIGVEAAFGVTLGDIVGDNLTFFEPLLKSKGVIGIPWYNVKGNHDANYDARPDHHLSSATFTRVYGPPYYSYNYGSVHFVVLNNPYFGQESGYGAKLDERQMEWLRNNLEQVPDDRLVVLMMHIPLDSMTDAEEIYRLLEKRPHTLSLSSHRHVAMQYFLTDEEGWKGDTPHHHIVAGTVCGAWYRGIPDEMGIPHGLMRDGVPKGYYIMTFDGNEYSARFKVSRRPADYQMNIYAPNRVRAAAAHETEVLANVFSGSRKSTTQMRLGRESPWIDMEITHTPDPNYVRQFEFESNLQPRTWRPMREPRELPHIFVWRAMLPADPPVGAQVIQVRTTDIHGQTFIANRVIHID
jgi:hypothetical protein